jgi:hypothetical protein
MRDDWYLYDPNNIVYLITDSKIKLIEDLPATASLYLMMELHMFFISILKRRIKKKMRSIL